MAKEPKFGLPGFNYPKPKGMMKQKPSTFNKYAQARRYKINKEIFDAMNPDGPTNPTRRGTRLANKRLNQAYGNVNNPPRTRMTKTLMKSSAKALRASRALNVAGLGLYAAEGIYKGYKRATSPGGKEFHGQFVDYTSKPTNRGKRGVNY